MGVIIKTELKKIKRLNIFYSGIALMFLSVLLTLFTSTAQDGSHWDFQLFLEQLIKNNMSMVFPAAISLVTVYLIVREQKDNTLKNIKVIPVSYKKIFLGKLIVGAILSIIYGLASAIFWIVGEGIVKFPGFSFLFAWKGSLLIIVNCFFLYIAVLPIIIVTGKFNNGHLIATIASFVYGYCGMFAATNMTIANMYPISASLGMIGYRNYDPAVSWNRNVCILSFLIVLILCTLLILLFSNIDNIKTDKKKKKKVVKKGW